MNKKFIALYKAYRGGEWFGPSLESIRPHTDGAVVVFSGAPWNKELTLPENCRAPLARFRARHPDYPVAISTNAFTRHERQYEAGLALVRKAFGKESAVLVVDTDEVWDADMLVQLREAIAAHPSVRCFRSRIWTYLKSPLYRVFPTEGANVTIALQDARDAHVTGRCSLAGKAAGLPDISFHHFCYVRADERDIAAKFHNTSTQEGTPSKLSWLTDIWPNLPDGTNLHMTPGWESAWGEIKRVTPSALPMCVRNLPFVQRLIAEDDAQWRDRLRKTPVAEQLLPLPTWDRRLYGSDLQSYFADDLTKLVGRMQTSYLEALWLAYWASGVPAGGRIVELGCGHGCTTTILATASPSNATVETIDPFQPYNEMTPRGLITGVMEGNEADFWDTLATYGVGDRIRHLPHNSDKVSPFLATDGYDLVLIDANHTFEWARNDLRLLWPLVRPGGLLAVHDYTTRFPGVMRAVDEFPAMFRIAGGTSLAYARKGAK